VKNWGPLWAYSAFQFESYNGVLSKLFNGTRKIGVEIANKCNLYSAVLEEYRRRRCSENIAFGLSMLCNIKRRPSIRLGGCVRFHGPSKLYYFNSYEREILARENINCFQALSFPKCSVNSVMYTTKSEKTKKRTNCVAEHKTIIYIFNKIFELDGCGFAFGQRLRVTRKSNNSFIYTVTGVCQSISVLKLQTLSGKYISSRSSDSCKILVKIPNVVENE